MEAAVSVRFCLFLYNDTQPIHHLGKYKNVVHIFFLQWCCVNNRIYIVISLPREIFFAYWCWPTSDTNMQAYYYKNDNIIAYVLYIYHEILLPLVLTAIQSSITFWPVHVSSTQEMPSSALLLVGSGIPVAFHCHSMVETKHSHGELRSNSSDASISASPCL